MIASQALYPMIAKKMAKQKILGIATIIALVGAVGFFLTCFPIFTDTPISLLLSNNNIPPYGADMDFGWALGGLMFCNYLFPFIFFFGAGLVYMVILVMFQDSIDYNEYEFGERKESVISAWRPLDVKLGSALLRGFMYLIFLSSSTFDAFNYISQNEGALNRGTLSADDFVNNINALIDKITRGGLVIIGVWIVIILVGCFVAVYLLIKFGYKITEERHIEIVAELEKRHAQVGFNKEELETPAPEETK